ncbi:MAG: VOC family protein [Anaerolineales bacterium]|nr:VOC family protein [Anaerolineales bacterium]
MLLAALPLLRVSSAAAAEAFYCGGLGFTRLVAYQPDPARADPCYLGLARDGVRLDLSSFSGDGGPGGVVGLSVGDVDALYAELQARGVPVALPPTDQTGGRREMYLTDGNCLRFFHSPPEPQPSA